MIDALVFIVMMLGCGIGLVGSFVSLPGWLALLGSVLALGGVSVALCLAWRDYREVDFL